MLLKEHGSFKLAQIKRSQLKLSVLTILVISISLRYGLCDISIAYEHEIDNMEKSGDSSMNLKMLPFKIRPPCVCVK